MTITERVNTSSDLRSWTDSLPLHYIYTSGVAGERFFSGLKRGRLIASRCGECGTKFIPPKAYCTNCFKSISDYEEVRATGRVRGIAKDKRNGKTYCFITFDGYQGGIIHLASDQLAMGDAAIPRFRPVRDRKGRMADIQLFEKYS